MWRATEAQEAMRQGHQGARRWLPLGTDMAQELFQGAVREHCRLSCVVGACNLRQPSCHLHTRVLLADMCWNAACQACTGQLDRPKEVLVGSLLREGI